jgi:hypothetical protein
LVPFICRCYTHKLVRTFSGSTSRLQICQDCGRIGPCLNAPKTFFSCCCCAPVCKSYFPPFRVLAATGNVSISPPPIQPASWVTRPCPQQQQLASLAVVQLTCQRFLSLEWNRTGASAMCPSPVRWPAVEAGVRDRKTDRVMNKSGPVGTR